MGLRVSGLPMSAVSGPRQPGVLGGALTVYLISVGSGGHAGYFPANSR